MAVRTARLAHGRHSVANTQEVVYTCPPGKTAIVKEISGQANGAGTHDWGFFIRSGVISVAVAGTQFTGGGQHSHSSHFLVLEPGDQLLSYDSVTNGLNFHVSGAELDGVAP